MAVNARRLAVEALVRLHREGSYSNEILDSLLRKQGNGREGLGTADQALFSRLFYGVIERCLTLDYVIAAHSSVKMKKMHPVVVELLRIGCYQLLYTDKVPASAAVNESVKLARGMGQEKSAGFINAVLRAVDRGREHLFDGLSDDEQGLAVRTSCPAGLISLWRAAYGSELARALAESANGAPPVTIRINTLKTTPEAFEKALDDAGVRYTRHPVLPACLTVENAPALKKLAQNLQICYYHQDAASQWCCFALDAKPGQRVADVCAAPGGKSLTAAQYMDNTGFLLACDIHPSKCDALESRAEHLGADIVQTAVRDASLPCPEPLVGSFDRVICDAPCSGLGVIRRKPEIRYKPLESVKTLPELQYKILHQSSRMVKPGGILQYSTCTLNPAENEEVAARFLAEHPDFAPRTLPLDSCFAVLGQEPSFQITLFPPVHQTDGFYMAGFVKLR